MGKETKSWQLWFNGWENRFVTEELLVWIPDQQVWMKWPWEGYLISSWNILGLIDALFQTAFCLFKDNRTTSILSMTTVPFSLTVHFLDRECELKCDVWRQTLEKIRISQVFGQLAFVERWASLYHHHQRVQHCECFWAQRLVQTSVFWQQATSFNL